MKVQVTINNVQIKEKNILNENEYNIHECEFEFTEEYNGLTKKAVFTGDDGKAYVQTIQDDKCTIPSEILARKQRAEIGVYAYDLDNEELLLRYSPRPTEFYIHEGSYKEAQNSTPPTPSEIEQLQAQITTNANNIEELQECCGKYDSDIADLKAEQITQNKNIQTNTETIGTITENITIINEALGTINENIGDLQEGQIEQNTKIQNNADDITEINQDINEINTSINDINQNIDDLEQDLTNYSLITETGSQINLNINSSNFQMTAILKDKNGNTIYTSNIIDLPLETMVVGASYDNTTKEVILTLQNGTTLRFSVADLVSGLVSTDQLTQILSNYYNKNEVDALIPDLTDYVKNTDYATSQKGGVIKTVSANGFGISAAGNLYATTRSYAQYTGDGEAVNISKGTLENVIAGKELINQTQLEESQALQDTEIEALQNKVEELETENENLRKALPQIKGEGTDFTLNNTSENKFVDLGLEGNTEQDAEPTPETLVPIKNVTGNANVKIQNKNLFVAQKIVEDSNNASVYLTQDGFIRYITSTSRCIIKPNIIKENTAYTFKLILKSGVTDNNNIGFTAFYTDGTSVSLSSTARTNRDEFEQLFTTDGTKTLDYLRSNFTSSKEAFIKIDGSMILEGSYTAQTLPSYVPHQEQNYPLTLGDIELNKIDTAQDYFYKENNKWYLHKEIRKTTISSVSGVGTASSGIKYASIGAVSNVLNSSYIYCENYINSSDASKNNSIRFAGVNLFVYDNRFTDVETAQSLLNGLEYYHIMATPTETEMTDTTLISQLEAIKEAISYYEQTNISGSSSELSPIITASAVGDLNLILNN